MFQRGASRPALNTAPSAFLARDVRPLRHPSAGFPVVLGSAFRLGQGQASGIAMLNGAVTPPRQPFPLVHAVGRSGPLQGQDLTYDVSGDSGWRGDSAPAAPSARSRGRREPASTRARPDLRSRSGDSGWRGDSVPAAPYARSRARRERACIRARPDHRRRSGGDFGWRGGSAPAAPASRFVGGGSGPLQRQD